MISSRQIQTTCVLPPGDYAMTRGDGAIGATPGTTITLDSSPSQGDRVRVFDYVGSASPSTPIAVVDPATGTTSYIAKSYGSFDYTQTDAEWLPTDVSNAHQNTTVIFLTSADSPFDVASLNLLSGYYPEGSEIVLLVRVDAGSPVILLLPASVRAGLRITVKDTGGASLADSITLEPQGAGPHIDAAANLVLTTPHASVQLVRRDSTSVGDWLILAQFP